MFSAILGIVLPLLPNIIAGVEKLFGGKKDSSQQKFDMVLQQAIVWIQNAIANGQLPKGTAISDPAVGGSIETIVQMLNKLGLLKGADTNEADILKALGPLLGLTAATDAKTGTTPASGASSPQPGDILRVVVVR